MMRPPRVSPDTWTVRFTGCIQPCSARTLTLPPCTATPPLALIFLCVTLEPSAQLFELTLGQGGLGIDGSQTEYTP